MNWQRYLPFLEWMPKYNGQTLRSDLSAGLTVGVMLVPQGMAYAMLAGLPPIYGLYGGLLPLVIYGLMGTSRQLSLGPVAVDALLILAGIGAVATPGGEEFIGLVILAGFVIGVLHILMGVFKMGFLVNFLSHPVIIGFTSAAAIIIAVSQFKYLFGFSIPRFEHSYETVAYAFQHIADIHWPSFIICVSGILLILIMRKISRALPGALLVTIIAIVVVAVFRLDHLGVKIVGDVPKGLPGFSLPEFGISRIMSVMPTVLTVAIIGVVESIGIAKVLEAKNKDTRVIPNQELLALGFSKVIGAIFQSLPTSASFTRSAVNDDAGAKTGMASIISALIIALTLLFLTSLFYYLPEAILASIVLVAVKGLFNIDEAVELWHHHRQDFLMMILTFVTTLALGIEEGVLFGVIFSLIMIIYRASKAHVAVLGRLPDTNYYRSIERFEKALRVKGMMIMRFDAQLFFGNIEYFKSTVYDLVDHSKEPLKAFVLDASCIEDVDSTGIHALEEIIDYLKDKGIQFQISGAIGPVRDILRKTGLLDKIGEENHFMYLQDAEEHFKEKINV
ncbi:MAG: solute carrier family 26 protein [Saprospiraceae bacterium]|nr:solute carrier family 26 protein [Saprospiraceae bacterium]